MADVSASSLVLFIASLLVATAVAGVLIDTVTDISDAVDERGHAVSKEIRTDVEIISDPGAPVYDGDTTISLYLKNTGLRPVDEAEVDVFVDGVYRTSTLTPTDGPTWDVDEVALVEISTTSPLSAGDHRVSVVVGTDTERYTFRT